MHADREDVRAIGTHYWGSEGRPHAGIVTREAHYGGGNPKLPSVVLKGVPELLEPFRRSGERT